MNENDPAYKGQSGYNPMMLAVYDVWVLKFMSRAVLKVPVARYRETYRESVRPRHLDVGPGTGSFLVSASDALGEVTLLDPNPHVLRHAGKRLSAHHPTLIQADVTKPLPIDGPFDSAALSFVLHCLRGPEANKAAAVQHVADVLADDGSLFGGTILSQSEPSHTRAARAFLRAANREGGFDNEADSEDQIRRILESAFQEVEVKVTG